MGLPRKEGRRTASVSATGFACLFTYYGRYRRCLVVVAVLAGVRYSQYNLKELGADQRSLSGGFFSGLAGWFESLLAGGGTAKGSCGWGALSSTGAGAATQTP